VVHASALSQHDGTLDQPAQHVEPSMGALTSCRFNSDSSDGQHDALSEAVRPRATGRDLDHLDTRIRQHRVKRCGELTGLIPDQFRVSRRRTATSSRSTRISKSSDEALHPSNEINPSTCTKIRYSSRIVIATIMPDRWKALITAGQRRVPSSGTPQVLRHQLRMLRHRAGRPWMSWADRTLIAALARRLRHG
jgi:hypothetical protein